MVHRRIFLTGLGGAALAAMPIASAIAAQTSERVPLSNSYAVNLAITPQLDLSAGRSLRLSREPERSFDANSIAIHAGRHRIGYLPGTHSKFLAPLMDAGFRIDANVAELKQQPSAHLALELFIERS